MNKPGHEEEEWHTYHPLSVAVNSQENQDDWIFRRDMPVVTRNLDVKQRLWVDSRRPTLSKATQFLQRLILCQPCHPIQRLLTSIAKVEFTEGIFPVVNAGQADP